MTLARALLLCALSLMMTGQHGRPAKGAQDCIAYEHATSFLMTEYGEEPVASGRAGESTMQLWINAETGSWTILAVLPDGRGCLIASGTDWRGAPPEELPL